MDLNSNSIQHSHIKRIEYIDRLWEELQELEKDFDASKDQKIQENIQEQARIKIEAIEKPYKMDLNNVVPEVSYFEKRELAVKTDKIINSIRLYGKEAFDLEYKSSLISWGATEQTHNYKNSDSDRKPILKASKISRSKNALNQLSIILRNKLTEIINHTL